jgi:hypothetical protein
MCIYLCMLTLIAGKILVSLTAAGALLMLVR